MTDMVHGTVHVQSLDPVLPRWWRTVDKWSIFAVLVLFGIGLLLGLASSPPLAARNGLQEFYYVMRQAQFGLLSIAVMFVVSIMSPTMIRRLGVIGFVCALIALMLLPFLGTDFGKGAVRWYSLGFASVQPSEFLKPMFVIFVAWFMAASFELGGPPGKLYSFIITVMICLLLAMQPDFGQAALVVFAWGVMYFVAGAPIMLLVGLAAGVALAGVVAYNSSEHFARRINNFLNGEVDPTAQQGFAENAIRQGGFFGTGVGEGQVKWSLPDAHTDYIIAVAAEEYGLIMVLGIIMLYCFILIRTLLRLTRERDAFTRIAGTGLISMFAVQAFINLGVAVRLLPAKGMTLPFVSYGGSSIIAWGLALGMILAFTRTRPQGEMEDVFRQGRT